MNIYLFKDLNYYIGDNLTEYMLSKAVILETEYIKGMQPVVEYDESGVSIKWVEEVEHEL